MKKHLLAGLAASGFALSAAPAMAQSSDEPVYFDGLYVAGSVSYDIQSNDGGDTLAFDTDGDGVSDNVNTAAGVDAFAPGFCNGQARSGLAADGCTSDKDDIGYAGRVGFDKRFNGGPFVAGVLLEGSSSDAIDYTSGFSSTPASYTVNRELDYAISARARAGFSPGDGRGLFYVTGGGSYAKIRHGFTTTNNANSFAERDDGDMVWGYQAGAGVELMVTQNVGLGLEYLYSNYKDNDFFVEVGQGTAPATNPFLIDSGRTDIRPSDTNFEVQSLRASLSFHF
ncbi:outer membrane protein [Pelagerythrobacter sp.]|uniref:outer membrane protein n=1 Tax=Pelagerythrobacter sp. TaxID=2800702 RepID=UPI0035B2C4E9